MDDKRFDELARTVGEGVPRRGALRLLVGGVFAAVGWLGPARAAAACVKPGRKCDKDQQCCDKAVCKKGRCRCKAGFEPVAGKCLRAACSPAQKVCDAPDYFGCQGAGIHCFCSTTTEGRSFCTPTLGDCDTLPHCTSSGDCPDGTVCASSCCDGADKRGLRCLPPCQIGTPSGPAAAGGGPSPGRAVSQ